MPDTVNWIAATEDFIEADVVCWIEAIWSDKKRGRGRDAKHVLIGKQQVTGQITKIDEEFVYIKVIEAVFTEQAGAKSGHLKEVGAVIRKKPESLVKGEVKRLPWEDEESRANIVREKK